MADLSKAAIDALVAKNLREGGPPAIMREASENSPPHAENDSPKDVQQHGEGGNENTEHKSIGKWPYVAMAAGQALDAGSTLHGWSKGMYEQNPLNGGSAGGVNHPVKMLAMKAGTTAAMSGLMKLFDKAGWDGAAKAIGYAGGVGGGVIAANNYRKLNKK